MRRPSIRFLGSLFVIALVPFAFGSPPGGHGGGGARPGGAGGGARPGGSRAGISGGAGGLSAAPKPELGGIGNFRDAGVGPQAGRFSSSFGTVANPRSPGLARSSGFSEHFGAGAGATRGVPQGTGATGATGAVSVGSGTAVNSNVNVGDVNIDADADIDVNGYPHGCSAPATDCGSVVPAYASFYGVFPGYYPVYYPVATSSASVTYTVPTSSAGQTTSEPVSSSQVQPLQPAPAQTSPTSQYPATVTAAVDALEMNATAADRMKSGTQSFRDRAYLDAAKAFRQAIPLDVDNALPRFSFAHALFALGDYENAAYSVRRGLDLMPEWVTSGNNLWAAYGEPKDFRDQRFALASACVLNPTDAEALTLLGYVDFFTGNLAGSRAAFGKLAELRPDDPLAPFFLTEITRVEGLQPKK